MAKKKTKKRIWISLAAIIIFGGGAFFYLNGQSSGNEIEEQPHVIAEIGTVIEKALAVGTIEPDNEIEVKSKISGVVNRIYAEPGDFVQEGEPLIEVRPDPTPLELAEAKRNLERTEIEKENLAKELQRMETLLERNLVSEQEYDRIAQQFEDVKVREQINRERLELLESGRIMMGETLVESVIRAPIDGYILEKMVDVGEPVVPLTSYQAGTALMSIAGMDQLLFKGTVDEIDVGKMEEGMPAELKIGALPGQIVKGEVSRISLKAKQQDNATVFPIEIRITDAQGAILRAGYSANADIIIKRVENMVTIPERVVIMRDGKTFVEVPGSTPGTRVEKEVELGLSDAITVAVLDGMEEGEKVLEKPAKSLTVR
ncbi:efflux RND transporter periplasmic adaptor subunit [Rhodohalobacter halophilus]|uniref:efflux RND transporter periplasmic adaptor subunit n=1 Tax=Rhodohalobacter halophilus TaxID=1812810 RepID=UPI00083F8B54|nr:efflux RND transporter periplasmic adaptor subunit [Rhodohalobacter halophilus]